jgi:fused signal recognition particle receptor
LYRPKHAIQVTLIDTAGRMNNSKPLMNELTKVVSVTKPDMKIFICDALTGNDAIDQAKKFYNHTEFYGVIMTKMDVDTKGGSAISISYITSKLRRLEQGKDMTIYNHLIVRNSLKN